MTPKPPETLEDLDDAERIYCALELMPVRSREELLGIQTIVNELHIWLGGGWLQEQQLRAKLLQQQLADLSYRLGGAAMVLPQAATEPATADTLAYGILSQHFEGLIPHPALVEEYQRDHPQTREPGAVVLAGSDATTTWLQQNRVATYPWLKTPPTMASPRLHHLVAQFEARLRERHGVHDWPTEATASPDPDWTDADV